jgi:hypothetical protein
MNLCFMKFNIYYMDDNELPNWKSQSQWHWQHGYEMHHMDKISQHGWQYNHW